MGLPVLVIATSCIFRRWNADSEGALVGLERVFTAGTPEVRPRLQRDIFSGFLVQISNPI